MRDDYEVYRLTPMANEAYLLSERIGPGTRNIFKLATNNRQHHPHQRNREAARRRRQMENRCG